MAHQEILLAKPVPWTPGLHGEYPGQECVLDLPGNPPTPMVFCWCPPTPSGRPFPLGSPESEANRSENESQRPVEFPEGFWLAKHLVSRKQWRAVMGANPSKRGRQEECPVDSVSWNDCQEFCRRTGLRLPTENEWEYACRAGSLTAFGVGTGVSLNSQVANFDGDYPYGDVPGGFKWIYREATLPVGRFPANAWGLHDLHGQLWEWCEDKREGGSRVLRGGGWFHDGRLARSAFRRGDDPGHAVDSFGFRPCPSSISPAGPVQALSAERGGSEARDERNDASRSGQRS